jgi:hypothetical protein
VLARQGCDDFSQLVRAAPDREVMRNIHGISRIALPLFLVVTACGSATRFSAEAREDAAAGAPGAGAPSAGGETEDLSADARPQPVEIRWVGGSASGGSAGAGSPRAESSDGGSAPSPDDPAGAGQGYAGENGSPIATEPRRREVIQTLHAVASLSGVLAAPDHPEPLYGFLSFDLRELPEGIIALDHAWVRTGDYVVPAPVPVLDVSFEELAQAPSAVPRRQIVTLPIGLSGDQLIPEALWPTLATDYAERAEQPYAQFRFDLPAGSSREIVSELLAHTSIEVDCFVAER